MKVCVLQPSYEGTTIDYQYYDPPRNLSRLLPRDEVDHVFLKKATTFRQIRDLRKLGYDIYVNLCEGYPEWEIPSIDVIHALEHFNLPYTGPTPQIYDPPKELMKLVAYSEGVKTPPFVLAENLGDALRASRELRFPLFVKPHGAGDSLGIDRHSLIHTELELEGKVSALLEEFDKAMIEEFIPGREFTVLVAANPLDAKKPYAYLPIEFLFPAGEQFKTYDLKVRQHHPECNVPCLEPELAEWLKDAARKIFVGFSGVGYGRVDLRLSENDGLLYFLEINFTCSVFYPAGSEGSADYILQHDGIGQSGFLRHIIEEGIARHRRRQKKYEVRPDAVHGYGIYAVRDLRRGEVIFAGEERAQRIVTRSFVEANWSESEREVFSRYAYPVSDEVYILWDPEPANWAPQNHSCDPNTEFQGLDMITRRKILKGEELTLDYSTFCNEEMEEFDCDCGAPRCRRKIRGQPFNGINARVLAH